MRKVILAATLLTSLSSFAETTYCESRLSYPGQSISSELNYRASANGLSKFEGGILKYAIKVSELLSNNNNNPTLQILIKDEKGILLDTMSLSPGASEKFVKTTLRVQEGILTVKCI